MNKIKNCKVARGWRGKKFCKKLTNRAMRRWSVLNETLPPLKFRNGWVD